MNQDNYIALIYKKLKKEINPAEQADLEKWADSTKENALLQTQLEDNWKMSKTALPPITVDAKKDFQGFKKRMQQHRKASNEDTKEAIIRPMNRRRNWLAIAAAIAIPLMAATWLFLQSPTTSMTIAQTTTGETKVIQLADGTKVTLNENTTFEYPATFAAADRQVQLTGEAFFEVAKDAARPFQVHTAKASVKVLGTIFNVRSIDTESNIQVSVEEGKVQFSSTITGTGVILTAGETGIYDLEANNITENKVNHKNASAWKTKSLSYKDVPLKTIIADLERLFKIKVNVTNSSMLTCRISAYFPEATPKIVLDYIVTVYKMELKEINATSFELNGGICE